MDNIPHDHTRCTVPITPYEIRITAAICQTPVEVYNQIVYTQQGILDSALLGFVSPLYSLIVDEVMAPSINALRRSDDTTGVISFTVPPSEQDAEYFEILLYNAANRSAFDEVIYNLAHDVFSTPVTYTPLYLNQQTLLNDVMRTNDQLVTIPNLNPCSAYFVQVSAVNCGTRITSNAMLLDLKDITSFSLTVSIPTTFATCSAWVATITSRDIADVQDSLNVTSIQRCGGFIPPCFADSSLTCSQTDDTKATFK